MSATSVRVRHARNPLAILHVHITDDLTGALLADVDAHSVADGLAYYLGSRHLDEAATEDAVWPLGRNGKPVPRTAAIAGERRSLLGSLDFAVVAHIEGTEPACDGCQLAKAGPCTF